MPRVDPQIILDDWEAVTQGALIEHEPDDISRAREQLARSREIEGHHWFDATVDEIDRIIAAKDQLELALPKMTKRALARERQMRFWRDVVASHGLSLRETTLHTKLQGVRREADVGFLRNGKMMLRWDRKAGMPLYDPDDAREEAARLARRQIPKMLELLKRPGHRAYYLCGTAPNSPAGELAEGQRALYAKWYRLIRACKRKSSPLFPIVGAIAVMESPLGRYRDWHPHLNIIVVCDRWLDFKQLKGWWHWNMEMRPLDGHQASLERAFREIIKYACRTVSEKSLAKSQSEDPGRDYDRLHAAAGRGAEVHHGRRGRPEADAVSAGEGAGSGSAVVCAVEPAQREAPNSQTGQAPAMDEWSAVEALEYDRAHRRFRRSRAYRALFGIPKPAPPDYTGARWDGRVSRSDGGAYTARFTTIESIPGDKSTRENTFASWKAAMTKLLGPPGQLDRVLWAHATVEKHYGPVSLSV